MFSTLPKMTFYIGGIIYLSSDQQVIIFCFTTQSHLLTTLKMKPFENIVRKGENAFNSIFSISHNIFYYSKNKFHFLSTFILSSANAFNLDQPANLLFGKELTNYHTIVHFEVLKMYSCGKHCEKRRNCL